MSNQAQQSQSFSDKDLRDKYVAWFRRYYGRNPVFDIPPHQVEFARYLLGQKQADAGEVEELGPVSECPHCGYEGEMVPAPQAGEVEA
jgi:hypothetical protein